MFTTIGMLSLMLTAKPTYTIGEKTAYTQGVHDQKCLTACLFIDNFPELELKESRKFIKQEKCDCTKLLEKK